MIDSNMNIKLIDFGFSIQTDQTNLNLFCGTPNYMSPEIILKKEYAGPPNDIWAFGVLAFKLLTGVFPFESGSTSHLNKRILSLDYNCPLFFHEDLKRIFYIIFKIDSKGRPSANQLLRFKFFKT